MDRWTEFYASLIGRILLGGFFLWNGIEETLNFQATVNAFNNLAVVIHYALILALIAITIEVLGGIALIIGFQSKLFAMLLVLYVVITSVLFFNSSTPLETQLFLQNMGITGGLLFIVAYGTNTWNK